MITRTEVHKVLNDALTTRNNLAKDPNKTKQMTHARLLVWCETTVAICRFALEKAQQ